MGERMPERGYSRIEMLAALDLLDDNEISDEELVKRFAEKKGMIPINLERGYYSNKFFLTKPLSAKT